MPRNKHAFVGKGAETKPNRGLLTPKRTPPLNAYQIGFIKYRMKMCRHPKYKNSAYVVYTKARLACVFAVTIKVIEKAEEGYYDRYFGWV